MISHILSLVADDHSLDDFIQSPIENTFELVKGQIQPMVGHTGLGEIIGSDLFASFPCPDLQFPILGDLCVLFLLGFVQQPGTEYFQGLILVAMLGFFILTGYDHS